MNTKKAHFIGIAGKGMSATALLLRQMGVQISGSDEGFYPPVSDYLKAEQIPFASGYQGREHSRRCRCHRDRQERQAHAGEQCRGSRRHGQRQAGPLVCGSAS